MRSGRRKVSECATALCSLSGATTQTSFDSDRATFSSNLMPGAMMPSSFAIRMRARDRSFIGSAIWSDHFLTAHAVLERLGDFDGPVGALVVFENGDQRAA